MHGLFKNSVESNYVMGLFKNSVKSNYVMGLFKNSVKSKYIMAKKKQNGEVERPASKRDLSRLEAVR